MPISLTYPGIYVEEIPSGVRTLVGVGTSITAFIGRSERGPVDEPVTIHNFGEFERIFGGLWSGSTMGYQVRQYFLNGGSVAVIIRVFNEGAHYTAAAIVGTSNLFTMRASSRGEWGNRVSVRVDRTGAPDADSFTLYARERTFSSPTDTSVGPTDPIIREEVFYNVSVNVASPRFVASVLLNESSLVRAHGTLPADAPETTVGDDVMLSSGGDDPTFTDMTVRNGLAHLGKVEQFNILCLPPLVLDVNAADATINISSTTWVAAEAVCRSRNAIVLVDPKASWDTVAEVTDGGNGLDSLGIRHENAAFYWPWVVIGDPLRRNVPLPIAPCGSVAGAIARNDAARGIWIAPAGIDARITGIAGTRGHLTNGEQGLLNPLGVNVLRSMPAAGTVIWGARTLVGADRLASEWKYLPVRRTALYIEESLYRGTQWGVFEPNDASLWSQIRMNVGAFMHQLFRQGAFQGATPSESYFVKCDGETTTQNDINQGVVNIVVGFAPLKPAEFVVIKLQQMAGQITS